MKLSELYADVVVYLFVMPLLPVQPSDRLNDCPYNACLFSGYLLLQVYNVIVMPYGRDESIDSKLQRAICHTA